MLDKMLCFTIFKELYLSFCFVNLVTHKNVMYSAYKLNKYSDNIQP